MELLSLFEFAPRKEKNVTVNPVYGILVALVFEMPIVTLQHPLFNPPIPVSATFVQSNIKIIEKVPVHAENLLSSKRSVAASHQKNRPESLLLLWIAVRIPLPLPSRLISVLDRQSSSNTERNDALCQVVQCRICCPCLHRLSSSERDTNDR